MPSIRIKRSYAAIQENADGQQFLEPPPRPQRRSRSWSQIYQQPQTSVPPLPVPEKAPQPRVRPRSHTVDGGPPPVGQDEGTPRLRARMPSRVRQHILSMPKVPRVQSVEQRDESLIAQARRSIHSFSTRSDRSDMISLEGIQEDILIPADPGHEPGRISRAFSNQSSEQNRDDGFEEHHHDDIVEHLDVIDPQVATVSTLTNAANAIMFPPLSFYSRKPIIVLPETARPTTTDGDPEKGSQTDEDNLDRHIEDVLTKRDKFKRVMKGVWSFTKTPMGVIVAFYGFNVIFWGTGIVFFLAKFINLHNANTQGFWVELCQQVETGLFSATSIGLIPFRALDTWRVYWIWHYKRKLRMLRQKAGLPELYDPDDLPDPIYDENYVHVLTDEDQADLHYQQHKFAQSQTWYRPHGTQTHRAFPINTALLICVLNDLNSIFQCLLSGCMWGLNRFQRPAWTTATTLPAAFICGIAAGFYIYWGGRKTKRHEQVEERLRNALALERPRREPSSDTFSAGGGDDSVQPIQGSAEEYSGMVREKSGISRNESTPTFLAPEVQPQDFVGRDDAELPTMRRRDRLESVPSVATVPIADQMTIPPVEELHESEGAIQGRKR